MLIELHVTCNLIKQKPKKKNRKKKHYRELKYMYLKHHPIIIRHRGSYTSGHFI